MFKKTIVIACLLLAGDVARASGQHDSADSQSVVLSSDHPLLPLVGQNTQNQFTTPLPAAPAAANYGGAQPFFKDALKAGTDLKTTAGGQLYWMRFLNLDASTAYVQIFNQVTANVTLGTTAATWTIRLASSQDLTIALPMPVALGGSGISMAVTTTATGNTLVTTGVSLSALFQ